MKANYYYKRQENILKELGVKMNRPLTILDLGCGNGDLVKVYRENGYHAFGCDFEFKPGDNADELHRQGYIALIDGNNYRLPFQDNYFDVIVSHQVLEHVQDFDSTFSELNRVLKDDGVTFHKFPSRWAVIESHIFIPFGSRFQNYNWVWFWTWLGFRKPGQQRMNTTELAKQYHNYLITKTNYLTRNQIKDYLKKYFITFGFEELLYLKYTNSLKFLYRLSKVFIFIPFLVSTFYTRIIYSKGAKTQAHKSLDK